VPAGDDIESESIKAVQLVAMPSRRVVAQLLPKNEIGFISTHWNDGEYVGPGFGADLLFTLKFDDAGNCKIVKTHQMSEKEVEKREKER
jgi:hypothetical protein